MKIAIVCPDGRSLILFCKGLINELKNIKNTQIYTLSSEGAYKGEVESLGVNNINIDIYRFISPVKDLKLIIKLYLIFKRQKFDLVYNISTKLNIYGTIAAKMAKVDHIVSHIVGLGSVFSLTGLKGRFVKFTYFALYRLSCRLSNKIWFTNKNDLKYFISHGFVSQKKVLLTNTCLDLDFYSSERVNKDQMSEVRRELGLSGQDEVVLMVARLIWPKGIRAFVEAAEILKDKYPFVKFLLIAPPEPGSYDEVPVSYINSALMKLPNFIWLQYRDDLRPYYALSVIGVLPTYYKEGGQPRALLEPMAMGKAVITTDSTDCCDVVEDGRNGHLIPIKNSKALAEAIEDLICHEDKRKEFGLHSRMKVEREFDEKVIVRQVIEAFLGK